MSASWALCGTQERKGSETVKKGVSDGRKEEPGRRRSACVVCSAARRPYVSCPSIPSLASRLLSSTCPLPLLPRFRHPRLLTVTSLMDGARSVSSAAAAVGATYQRFRKQLRAPSVSCYCCVSVTDVILVRGHWVGVDNWLEHCIERFLCWCGYKLSKGIFEFVGHGIFELSSATSA